MKLNKNPVRAMRKLKADIRSFQNVRKAAKIAMPEKWDGRKKNILVMVNSLSRGGAQRVACRLASGLTAQYNVALLYGSNARYCYPLDPNVEVLTIPALNFDPGEIVSRLMVRTIKKNLQIDLAISLMLRMNQLNVLSKGKERVIVSERNNPVLAHPETFGETKKIYARADHVVFQTREVQSLYDSKTQAHSTVLPNPVSVSVEAAAVPSKKIVNAARLHKNKNQEMLIRAFAGFSQRHPEYTLEFYGDGSMRETLRDLALCLGIKDKVIFHGNVNDIHEQIADAACFVLSSNVEGMPNALLEAMMMGLPCISTDCTGAKEVIRDGWNGLLVKVGDEAGLRDALEKMTASPEFAGMCGKNAKITAQDFSLETVIEQWIRLFEKEMAAGQSIAKKQ